MFMHMPTGCLLQYRVRSILQILYCFAFGWATADHQHHNPHKSYCQNSTTAGPAPMDMQQAYLLGWKAEEV